MWRGNYLSPVGVESHLPSKALGVVQECDDQRSPVTMTGYLLKKTTCTNESNVVTSTVGVTLLTG